MPLTHRRRMQDFQIIEGDCAQTDWPDDVSLVLTDPPSGTTNAAWDTVPDGLWGLLVDIGAEGIVTFADFRLLASLAGQAGDLFRYDMVWEKSRRVGILSASQRPVRAHELIGVFGHPAYHPQRYRIPDAEANIGAVVNGARHCPGSVYNPVYGRDDYEWRDDGTRLAGSVLHAGQSVWDVGRHAHPTAKPVNLLRLLLRMYTSPGDLVADPFTGSGSTAVACVLEGRRFIGTELSPEYAGLARRRVKAALERPMLDVGEETLDPSWRGWCRTGAGADA